MMKTRIALPRDQFDIRQIRELAFATVRNIYTPKETASLADGGDRSNSVGIVALVDDVLLGTVEVLVDAGELRLSCLAVHPDFTRRGIARSLISHAEEFGKESNCHAMTLCTIKETGNVKVFKRLGFTVVAENFAEWCTSERFAVVHEVQMTQPCG